MDSGLAGHGPRPGMTADGSLKDPFALQVDDLPRLGQREAHGVVVAGVSVGADEAVLLAHAADLALDHARGLIMALVLERRRADDEAFVFDRFGGVGIFRG